ncbi:hypothetical protein AB6A40_003647 [Gnathostoma spinigerum]|uniref:Uncharacterized protein n=1 Tax=Gnathostoma spinigerum TaxID=75299 RepID=A0ABD6EAB4_9BILA
MTLTFITLPPAPTPPRTCWIFRFILTTIFEKFADIKCIIAPMVILTRNMEQGVGRIPRGHPNMRKMSPLSSSEKRKASLARITAIRKKLRITQEIKDFALLESN